MTRHPFPSTPGQVDSVRALLYRRPVSAEQRRALATGRDVTFDAAWLEATFPGAMQHPTFPAAWGMAGAWVLSGDNDLQPAS
jgi:hypothetical protein